MAALDFFDRLMARSPVLGWIGVALLGARISVEMLARLGWPLVLLVVAGVVATILFALAVARLFGRRWRFALLTGGAVAICGASAAMAIAAVLPRHERSERDLVFTVLSVTVLSTVAMVIYPMLTGWLGHDDHKAGVFLGGTIHDVTEEVHPALIRAAVAAARAIDIPVTGIDLMVKSPREADYAFIEANERPGLANHEPQPTAERFIDLLFPLSIPAPKDAARDGLPAEKWSSLK